MSCGSQSHDENLRYRLGSAVVTKHHVPTSVGLHKTRSSSFSAPAYNQYIDRRCAADDRFHIVRFVRDMTDTDANTIATFATIFRPPHRLESALLYSFYKLLYTRRARCSLLGAELLPSASTVDTRLLSGLSASYRLHGHRCSVSLLL